jgi:PPOX class probable F420-dependent enzyme
MRLDAATARGLFQSAEVARLATVGGDGRPQLVPVVFAVSGEDVLYTAVDAKPKATSALRRLANIAVNPAVCLLADHYSADWAQLWWVRADGDASVHEPTSAEARRARELLVARYSQYATTPPLGTVVAVRIQRWTGWAASAVEREQ